MSYTMKKNNVMEVLFLIDTIRNSFVGADKVYTQGSCFQFFKILRVVFPQAEAYYDSNHVITEIDGTFYDITGIVHRERHLRMSIHYPECSVRNCKFSIFGNAIECPVCDEILEVKV